jgi:hypothetical protein
MQSAAIFISEASPASDERGVAYWAAVVLRRMVNYPPSPTTRAPTLVLEKLRRAPGVLLDDWATAALTGCLLRPRAASWND